ncbi:MAG: Ger(x)C family spore germination protein [Clostridiales bacterium]|nr:Ger(x)C family spore germination protein [Clostridiales bacterium]
MRKALLTAISTLLLLTAGACGTGARELDERSYVNTVGVDRGVTDKMRFTFKFSSLAGMQGQNDSEDGRSKSKAGNDMETITIDCPTIQSGITMIMSSYSRRLNFTHATYLIISEELARDTVEPVINSISRSSEIRRTMYVIVTKGKAMDFIEEFNPFAGASVSKSQEIFMENAEQSSLYVNVRYNEFANRVKCTKCHAIATMAAISDPSSFKEEGSQEKEFKSEGDYYAGEIPQKSRNKFNLMGSAIFNGMTMIGELNGNETRSVLMLRGTFKESQIAIPDPEDASHRISAVVFSKGDPDIKITFEEGKIKIHAAVFFEAALQNAQITTTDEKERITQLEEAYARFIGEKLDQTIKKCQELNCEVFDFGYTAIRQFWTIQEWEEFDWLSNFHEAEVTTEVDFIIRRTGTNIATEDEKKAEG